PHFVEARIGAVAVFFFHLSDFFFLGLGSAGLSPSAASFAKRKARRCAVRLRIATSAAAISAIALMPSASWASFRLRRISFSSAALLGSSSFITCLKIHGAHGERRGGLIDLTMARIDKGACFGRMGREKRYFVRNRTLW